MSDVQDAITYAQTLDEVDPGKIALWGASYAGGNVMQVAAFDRRVKAVLTGFGTLDLGGGNFCETYSLLYVFRAYENVSSRFLTSIPS